MRARRPRDGTPITVADTIKLWDMARQAAATWPATPSSCCSAPRRCARPTAASACSATCATSQMYRIHPSSQPWLDPARARSHWGMPINRYGR